MRSGTATQTRSERHRTRPATGAVRAVTLIELLIVMLVIGVLIAVLGTAVGRARASARSFVCKSNLRTVAFEFMQFADESTSPDRGESARDGRAGFYLEDFQEHIYGVDEFWDRPETQSVMMDARHQPLMCPAGPSTLERHAGLPCGEYAVTPVPNVSVALNMRLYRASVRVAGRDVLRPVRLTRRILDHGSVPLALDIDGATAAARSVLPYYAAPPAGDTGRYGDGLFWFPATRHGDAVNVCFVGGHVLSSTDPANETSWDWAYQPPPE